MKHVKRDFVVVDDETGEEVSTHSSREQAEASVVAAISKTGDDADDVAFYIVERLTSMTVNMTHGGPNL